MSSSLTWSKIILWIMLQSDVKIFPPRPGIEPGPSTWQAEILTTRLSRTWRHRLEASDTEGRHFRWIFQKSFEPDLNQRPMDVWYITTTVHRSTNWAIEGWMVAIYKAERILIISNNVLELHTYLSLLLKDLHMLESWCQHGDVAQMVERSLSMWEVGGSIPPVSKIFFHETFQRMETKK